MTRTALASVLADECALALRELRCAGTPAIARAVRYPEASCVFAMARDRRFHVDWFTHIDGCVSVAWLLSGMEGERSEAAARALERALSVSREPVDMRPPLPWLALVALAVGLFVGGVCGWALR